MSSTASTAIKTSFLIPRLSMRRPYVKRVIHGQDNIVHVCMETRQSRYVHIANYATFWLCPDNIAYLLELESICLKLVATTVTESPTFIIETELLAMLPEGYTEFKVVEGARGQDGIAPEGVVVIPLEEYEGHSTARIVYS